MIRGALLAVLVLACATAAGAQQARQTKDLLAEIRKNPLQFHVARGDDNACGPGCNEWIAAEGYFDAGAAHRFQNFLARLGPRKLPVFFHSPGGVWQSAQVIGRVMRERSMTAGVARTFPEACIGVDASACDAAKKSGKDVNAHWSSIGAQCNSACVYALLGASHRLVPFGSSLGVHSSKQTCAYNNGAVELDPKDPRCHGWLEKIRAEQRRYVQQMGIDIALFELAYKTPYEEIRFLSREEIAHFGIDRNELQEGQWMIILEGSAATMMKYVIEVDQAGEVRRTGAIQIACPSFGTLSIRYYRLAGQSDETSHFDCCKPQRAQALLSVQSPQFRQAS